MTTTECDVLILGAGQAASPLMALTKSGKKVIVAERGHVGGSCVNFGCTPTKAVLASARLAAQARRAAEFGLRIPTVEPDFAEVLAQARRIVEHSRRSLEEEFGMPDGPRLLRGHARFVGKEGERYAVEVGEARVLAPVVVLNTGTRSAIPPIEGLDRVDCIHAGNWLHRDRLPRRLALLGGGYISIEMCQFYRRMGAEEVTVIDRGDQILAQEDPEVAKGVQEILEREGVRFRLKTSFDKVEAVADGFRLTCSCEEGPLSIDADQIFVATGRKPNTDDLGLETVGVATDEKGHVRVDERLHTTAPGVYAAGDVRGGPMFTHTAWDDGRVVATQLAGGTRPTTERVLPYGVFTDPELGRVGMSERQAKKAGKRYSARRFDMASNALAQERRATDGFIKLLIEDETDRILGAAVLAEEGADMVQIYTAYIQSGLPYTVLRDSLTTHPTWTEAIQSVVL